MKITKDLHGRLQIINLIGFLCIPILGYFDKTVLGVGISLTLSGLIFFVAFGYKTRSLYFDWMSEKFFNWLFDDYAHRAANFLYGTILLIIGIITLNQAIR